MAVAARSEFARSTGLPLRDFAGASGTGEVGGEAGGAPLDAPRHPRIESARAGGATFVGVVRVVRAGLRLFDLLLDREVVDAGVELAFQVLGRPGLAGVGDVGVRERRDALCMNERS